MPEVQPPQPENAFRTFQKELKRTNQLLASQTSFFKTFLRGMLAGVGGFLGATIVITLLLWTLSSLQVVPVIGDLANSIIELFNENISN